MYRTSAGSSTRAWPCRSTSRPSSGASSACASAKVAETAPASAYEPVVAATSRTTPSVCMESGKPGDQAGHDERRRTRDPQHLAVRTEQLDLA